MIGPKTKNQTPYLTSCLKFLKLSRLTIQAHTEQTFQAVTFPSHGVALWVVWVDARWIAVARNTFLLRISPHVGLALVTLPSSVSSPE